MNGVHEIDDFPFQDELKQVKESCEIVLEAQAPQFEEIATKCLKQLQEKNTEELSTAVTRLKEFFTARFEEIANQEHEAVLATLEKQAIDLSDASTKALSDRLDTLKGEFVARFWSFEETIASLQKLPAKLDSKVHYKFEEAL